jgi:hypothetical protein
MKMRGSGMGMSKGKKGRDGLLIPPKSKYQIRDQFRSLEKSDDDATTIISLCANHPFTMEVSWEPNIKCMVQVMISN